MMPTMPSLFSRWSRRAVLAAAAALLAGCAQAPLRELPPPIVFVHGNGDTAALWTTTLWRFESNGWPRDRLHAIDLPYPLARDATTRTSPAARRRRAHAVPRREVDKVLAATGARRWC
jgi:triacylglycerol lipase